MRTSGQYESGGEFEFGMTHRSSIA